MSHMTSQKEVEKVDKNYGVEDDNGAGEDTSSLQILNEFKILYEERIRNINPNAENKAEIEVKIMTEWIRDLDAQNAMLVRTIEELEEAACSRVKMLEQKLKHTSCVLSQNMLHYTQPYNENLNQLSDRITQLERDENDLQRKIEHLQSDIRSLLELIRRAEVEKRWRLDGIQFFEIKTTDIPITLERSRDQADDIKLLTQQKHLPEDNGKYFIEYQFQLRQKVDQLNEKLKIKESMMQQLVSKLDNLKNKLKRNVSIDYKDLIHILEFVQCDSLINNEKEMLQKTEEEEEEEEEVEEVEEKEIDIDNVLLLESNVNSIKLKNELDEKLKEIKRLRNTINALEKESQESREALTQEVADKHDTIMNLKDKVLHLEEQLRQAKIQLQFKIDIIKEMRRKMISLPPSHNAPSKVHINSNALSQKVSWSDDFSDVDTEKELIYYNNEEQHNSLITNQQQSSFEITKQQFNAMEEFRICTVEAQAATEDLREEISNVTYNLNGQYQSFTDLNKIVEKMHGDIIKTTGNLTNVLKDYKIQIEENVISKNTISMREIKLKDIKNEINETRVKMSSSAGCDEINDSHDSIGIVTCLETLLDKLVDEVDYIICNLGIYISKEDYTLSILNQVYAEFYGIETHLEELHKHTNQVFQDNEATQKILSDKTMRLDKLEKELDYAHTKMQDTLESIVFVDQQKAESSDYNQHRHHHDHHCQVDTSMIKESIEDYTQLNNELEQLKSTLCSQDKLLQHKDEIIRIQKDTINVMQGEVKDLQSKIDAQVAVINQYVEERNNLLEQNSLQKETIQHLQNAIVKAKRSVNNNRQQPQKSGIDLTVSDVWSPITPAVFNNDDVHDV